MKKESRVARTKLKANIVLRSLEKSQIKRMVSKLNLQFSLIVQQKAILGSCLPEILWGRGIT
jgi:hypothetical protein